MRSGTSPSLSVESRVSKVTRRLTKFCRSRRLNSPSTHNVVLVIEPTGHLHRLDHLLDAISRSRAQVERPILALLARIRVDGALLDGVQCRDVAAGEIDDMEVVTYTSPVDGREIVAKDFEGVVDPADSDGGEEGKEVVRLALGVFADLAGRVGTAGAERGRRSATTHAKPRDDHVDSLEVPQRANVEIAVGYYNPHENRSDQYSSQPMSSAICPRPV